MQREVARNRLLVVAYHDFDSYFRIPQNQQRDQYYNRPYRPVAVFDGLELLQGGSGNPHDPNTYARYRMAYLRRANIPSPIHIAGVLTLDGEAIPRRANLIAEIETRSELRPRGPLKISFVLYEDNIDYSAPNGETHFDWVARAILQSGNLTITQPGESMIFTRSVDLNPQWVAPNLGIAVFVQHDPPGNKEILGAADVRLSTPD